MDGAHGASRDGFTAFRRDASYGADETYAAADARTVTA